ncbi:MAG: ABC transporter substrate-binding protein [Azospirillaceae bacterium]
MTKRSVLFATVCAAALTASAAQAQTLRWSSSGDGLTLDPHAQNHGPTTTVNRMFYDPLLERDVELNLVPALATSFEAIDEDTWEFVLREGVTFHDGAAFDSEDVVFSINRARSDTSDFRAYLSTVTEVEAVDQYTVRVHTDGPDPILPQWLTSIFMMDSGWAEANDVLQPQNYAEGEETHAVRNANGTGPYSLVSREQDVRTVAARFDGYWGADMFPNEIEEIVYTPISSPATRVAALLSGEVDFILNLPLQDQQRVDQTDGVRVLPGLEVRAIFLGLNQSNEDLDSDNVDGANPFADHRVREAMYRAINAEAIRDVVMRGQSLPAGMITSPGVNGYSEELDARLPFDVSAARALMAEAGYADGFETTLNCPNDRYTNDEAICQAVVGMLAQIGITVNLVAQPNSVHFAELQQGIQDFYMLGWGVPTFDSEYVFRFLFATREGDLGTWNFTGYSNPDVDQLIADMQVEVNFDARDEIIQQAWEVVNGDIVYLPLHHEPLSWGAADHVEIDVRGNNEPLFKYVTFAE